MTTTYEEAKAKYEAKQRELDEAKKILDEASKEWKKDIVAKIKSLMTQYEVSFEDLGGKSVMASEARKPRSDKGKKKDPKYRDPVTGIEWNGMGRAPACMAEAKKKGDMSAFEINKQGSIS